MHETAGCAAAVHIINQLSDLNGAHAVVTTGPVLVGFVGSDKLGMKRPVVVGHPMDDLGPLSELAGVLECGVLITEAVAKKVEARFDVMPVDVVTLHHTSGPVYEVLAEDTSREQQAAFEAQSEGYKVGFSRFVARRYEEAIAFLTKFLENYGREVRPGHLRQALRLVRLCIHFQENLGSLSSTFSRRYPGWEHHEKHSAKIPLPLNVSTLGLEGSSSNLRELTLSPSSDVVPTGFDADLRKKLDAARKQQAASGEAPTSNPLSPTNNRGDLTTGSVTSVMSAPAGDEFFQASNDATYRRSEKLLGTGATSQVYLGLQDDGSLVALKYVTIPDEQSSTAAAANNRSRRRVVKKDELEEVVREVNLLAPLRHDNIVAFLGSAISGNKLVIVTEYVSGGSLTGTLQSFGSLPVRTVKRYLGDILHGLQYLHRNGIVHRDIKPHNVLLQIDGQCKLTDFGAAAQLSTMGSNDTNVIGTPLYMAPEACLGKATAASDIWSLGIMTVELITGRLPWGPEQLGEPFIPPRFIYRLGHDESVRPVVPVDDPRMTSAAVDLVNQCLQREEGARATLEQLLTHPFLM
jgi:serine/threonine-protein kinase RIO1